MGRRLCFFKLPKFPNRTFAPQATQPEKGDRIGVVKSIETEIDMQRNPTARFQTPTPTEL